ncbi:succinylglutamate desuccinylase/aspartoacylase family protein [Lyngbya confervoides]|uniref:Succinylglutamate desuccinylase/aspartoacylase family protein n=1 Tax=Lyngbya confervoides BDU141951 TaxID=1574623 RepID=A0ABD4SZ71_9CYAN|nr:succinylglutamate desuccinylase/aspartoacylase family protein [Lyngbya confervoides]MCM1981563.1 succinylglutamate desuccinylase/aspartoacylase family protein [Lyngbya confervoides BDU141951]
MNPTALEINGTPIAPGEQQRIDLPVARLPTRTLISLPVTAIHGIEPGPKLWLSAAIHGDELNGVEIIRRVVERIDPLQLRGAVIAVPIVNVFGFIEQSRYLPDRRDLNRSFPGSTRGSLASRLAHLFMSKIVSQSTHGIDLHTASNHRTNWPQIRANLDDPETLACAQAFGPPIVIHSSVRDGSLRQAVAKRGIPVLLYEAGEALRFDREAIQVGVEGIFRVMVHLHMLAPGQDRPAPPSRLVRSTHWIRASHSGILRTEVELGQRVRPRQRLGFISDAFGDEQFKVTSRQGGIVIGCTRNPLVSQGDGIIHLAALESPDD